MVKTVATAALIKLGGHDISEWVTRWSVESEVGEINTASVDILKGEGGPVTVTKAFARDDRHGKVEYAPNGGGNRPGAIFIYDTDITSHVAQYCEVYRPGKGAVYRLFLHADAEILTINGTAPWVYPDGAAS